jgi:carbamoyltransferase
MIILGIGDSHDSHACIVRDGKLEAVISEERLSRSKADMGYPYRSIDKVMEITGVDPSEIDVVAVAGKSGDLLKTVYKINTVFTVKDWISQCHKIWKPVLLDSKKFDPFEDFDTYSHLNKNIKNDKYYPLVERLRNTSLELWSDVGMQERRKIISKHINIDPSKIKFYRHEDCHQAYGYYSNQINNHKTLIFTVEGGGDDSSATVSTVLNGIITEKWRSNEVMLGRLYRYVTLILGMLPVQHEYKVMGLAPYGSEYHGKRSLDFFRTIDSVEGTTIVRNSAVKDMYFSVKKKLEGERFDGIAWGLQTYLEEILQKWIGNNVKKHQISNVVFSGGVAQNIKAAKSIVEMPEVESVWIGPASGDGSLGIGAAWLSSVENSPNTAIKGMKSAYLGTEYSIDDIDDALNNADINSKYHLIRAPSVELISKWLDEGKIIARFSGRMEFGQRALGNRSILADPRRWDSVERINNKIKYRDFWMPFTPSMTIEEADRLLINPKNVYSPFMTMAFDLKEEYIAQLPAVIHPADKTVRPQMVKHAINPQYYELLEACKRRTGLGVLLNTSFNLHGEAIVESPDDAISTFERSELDILLFDHVAISRSKV